MIAGFERIVDFVLLNTGKSPIFVRCIVAM